MNINELLLVAPNKIERHSRKLDPLKENEVIIKVVSCGICSSEFPVISGETYGQPGISYRYKSYPINIGHEVSGIVYEVGSKVRDFKTGDRVTGLAYFGSGFSDYVVAPSEMLILIPNNLPIEFALGEPVMAAVNAVQMSQTFPNANNLFLGDGFMSLMTIAALSNYKDQNIIVVGHHENRLNVAKEIGANHIINAKHKDAYWEIRNLLERDRLASEEPWTGGVDIAFEFTGKMSNLQLCASLCKAKSKAKLMMTSYYKEEKFTLGHYLINRAPLLMPSFPNHSDDVLNDLKTAISLISRNINFMERVVTHAFKMEDINIALDYAHERKDGFIKGILCPDMTLLESDIKRVY
jgi:L-iditol 2-dehydrogenase